MTDSEIRVGIIGYGYSGKVFHAPLIQATPGLRLTAIASHDAARVHADLPALPVVRDPADLFADPQLDLIILPTPNATHYPLARAALLAGKHVVVDKPFTLTLAQAQELQQLAKQQQRLLSVFHNRRWDGDFLTVQALLAQRTLGDVVWFESHFDRFRPQVRQRWREQAVPGAGLWYDLGPHLLDQTIQLLGMPQAIQADMAKLRSGAQADDYFHVILHYPRCRAALHASMLTAADTPRFILHGSEGSYVKYGLDPQEAWLKSGRQPGEAGWGEEIQPGRLSRRQADDTLITEPWPGLPGNYLRYYAGIRDALRGQGENPVPIDQAVQVMAVLERGLEAATQQKTLSVN